MGKRLLSIVSALAVAVGFGAAVIPAQVVLAAALVAITGSTKQVTTNPADQFNPAISGNVVTYTSLRNGNPDVFYYDLSSNTEHQVTTNHNSQLGDVSGGTIAYTTLGPGTGNGDIYAYSVAGANTTPVAVDSTLEQTNPGVGGSLVAWEQRGTGNFDIYAQDISTNTLKPITNNSGSDSHNPNVSGRLVAYWTQTGSSCQILVTNFDSLATTQLTTGTSCNQNPDISGSRVVYQANRDGNQDIYFFDLNTGSETRINLPGVQQNSHISGDWISWEDLNSGASVIDLYYAPTGQLFTVPSPCSTSQTGCGSYLSDIDGHRVAFTSNASGVNQVYVYEFTVTTADQPLTITRIGAVSTGRDAAAGVTFKDADPNGNLSQYSGTIDWGDHTAPSAALFAKNPFGGFVAGGIHRYAATGTYTITVTINDIEGATASRTTTLRVTNRDD